MSNGALALLEVLSGPEDGVVLPIPNQCFVLGPCTDALLKLEYDSSVPENGVRIYLEENGLYIDGVGFVSFGTPFQVGQVWVRVCKPKGGKEG